MGVKSRRAAAADLARGSRRGGERAECLTGCSVAALRLGPV